MHSEEILEKLYDEHIEENLETEPQSFLDANEFKILKKLQERSLLHYVRNPGSRSEACFFVSQFIEYFKTVKEPSSVRRLWLFLLSLLVISKESCFSKLEKEILKKLALRICFYINGLAEKELPLLENGQDSTGFNFDFEKSIAQMKIYKDGFDLQDAEFKEVLDSLKNIRTKKRYSFMRDVYREGRELLQYPENAELLFFLKNRTEKDPKHNEYFATGLHNEKEHRNFAICRGTVKSNGIKSSNPEYKQKENVVFHSHPSLSPLSINGLEEGDLGHAEKAEKQVFVVNSNGDIFYTNPDLSYRCFHAFDHCKSSYGQVFLGNIKEFLK